MTQPLPPLNALRAFEVAARQGSFARAAEELNVTPAAVSHQVKRLEEYLDVRLFRRLPRGLALTESGERLLPEVTGAFQRLAHSANLMRESTASRTIAISVAPSLASRWLVPRIEHFRRRYPGFELRIDARDQRTDFRRDNIDVALRYGPGDYEDDLHVEQLPPQMVYPVCSPRLIESGPPLERVQDLRNHNLLHVGWPDDERRIPDWASWLASVGAPEVSIESGPRFTQQAVALEAALAGQGIALANDLLAADDLAADRLVRPLQEAAPQEFRYSLVCLPAVADTARVRAFREWVFAELKGG